jgi:hypothetical protein
LDLTGKVFIERDGITSGDFNLETSGLPSGVYIIKLRGPVIYTGKMVIE